VCGRPITHRSRAAHATPGSHYALRSRSVPAGDGRENRMAFAYRLEHEDGTPADPPTFKDDGARLEPWRHDPALG
jgi:hypothetical protein